MCWGEGSGKVRLSEMCWSIGEISVFRLDNRKKCNYSMYHNKGEEEEEYAEYPGREEYPLAGRYSQKDAAEGSFGAGRLMAGNEVQKPAAGFHVNPALKENEMCREISVIN